SIQSMERFSATRIRIRRPAAIELAFEPRRETVVRRLVRARSPSGRHDAGAQLQDNFLPHGGISRNAREIESIECDGHRTALFLPGGVTRQTVALEGRATGCNR